MDAFEKTPRNTVKRIPKRAHYDRKTIYSILDEAIVAHVGFCIDGQPYVIPTGFGRDGDTLFIHGATTSRLMKQLDKGVPVCVTVTHIDGLVLARSAFHHSMNYRSVILFGTAKLVEEDQKEAALFCISENILKGRWDETRPPNSKELKATSVLAIEIEEASAKIREGGPKDEPEDYDLPFWAGVVPFRTIPSEPLPDDVPGVEIPLAPSVKRLLKSARLGDG